MDYYSLINNKVPNSASFFYRADSSSIFRLNNCFLSNPDISSIGSCILSQIINSLFTNIHFFIISGNCLSEYIASTKNTKDTFSFRILHLKKAILLFVLILY
jgi:hypothetical protein